MTATETRPVVRSQLEPRLVERRRDVRDQRRRRIRRRWALLGVLIGLLAAVVGLGWSPLADVDTLAVAGNQRLGADDLRAASGLSTGDHLALVDLAAARDRLRALPLVAAASVEREWPDAVRISVVEESPLLRLVAGEKVRIVSTTGRFLPADLEGADTLPVLEVPVGFSGDEEGGDVDELPDGLRSALVVIARIPPTLADRLSVARIDKDGAMSFGLADGATVEFGSTGNVPAKLSAIEAFLDQVTTECLDVLDVRNPDRVTASRIAGCSVPAPTDAASTADEAADEVAAGTAGAVSGTADGGTNRP